MHTLYFERMKSYCSTSIKSLDVKARQEGNYSASNRMRFWATDFASEASFEKAEAFISETAGRWTGALWKQAHGFCSQGNASKAWQELLFHGRLSLDLFFDHGAFSDLMRIMWYHCRCKSCSEGRQIKALCKVQESSKTISFLPPLQRPWTLQ